MDALLPPASKGTICVPDKEGKPAACNAPRNAAERAAKCLRRASMPGKRRSRNNVHNQFKGGKAVE